MINTFELRRIIFYYKRIGIKGIQYFMKNRNSKEKMRQYAYNNYYSKLKEEDYEKELKDWYYLATRRKGKYIDNPETFNDKVQWLKLHDSTSLKTKCADKYLVREYVSKIIGDKYLIPLLGVWDRAEDIDFNKLPEKFVLKSNHGSGQIIVVKDKNKLNIEETIKKCNQWLERPFGYPGMEIHYFKIPRKIIAEKLIEEMDGNLHDYKIYCFNGVPKFIEVIGDRDLKRHTGYEAFYDVKWNKTIINSGVYPEYQGNLSKPKTLNEMLEISKLLSKDFKYVRVDLYEIKGKVLFGELTFTPASGTDKWTPESANLELGKLIKL